MANFLIYKFEFKPNRQLVLKEGAHGGALRLDADGMRQYFTNHLAKHSSGILQLQKEKNGEKVICSAQILASFSDVTIIRAHNVKDVKVWQELKEKPDILQSYPHSLVILDCRQGACQMAIQKNSSFSSPHVVKEMIVDYVTRYVPGCRFEARVKLYSGEFWDVVNNRKKEGDTIRSIKLDFDQKNGQIDTTGVRKKTLTHLLLGQILGAAKSSYNAVAGRGGSLNFDRKIRDCKEIVHLCSNNGYSLRVQFRVMGYYQYGKSTTAMYRIPDEVIGSFTIGQLNQRENDDSCTYDLIEMYLDKIRNQEDGYYYEENV